MENVECVQPLPRNITSTHMLCAEKRSSFKLTPHAGVSTENDIPEEFTAGLMHLQERKYSEAFDYLQLCHDVYPPAKYQMACMWYDGLGCKENHSKLYMLDPNPHTYKRRKEEKVDP